MVPGLSLRVGSDDQRYRFADGSLDSGHHTSFHALPDTGGGSGLCRPRAERVPLREQRARPGQDWSYRTRPPTNSVVYGSAQCDPLQPGAQGRPLRGCGKSANQPRWRCVAPYLGRATQVGANAARIAKPDPGTLIGVTRGDQGVGLFRDGLLRQRPDLHGQQFIGGPKGAPNPISSGINQPEAWLFLQP